MDGNGKKIIKNLRFGKKLLSSSKTCESVGNAKQTIFYFWPSLLFEGLFQTSVVRYLNDFLDMTSLFTGP